MRKVGVAGDVRLGYSQLVVMQYGNWPDEVSMQYGFVFYNLAACIVSFVECDVGGLVKKE